MESDNEFRLSLLEGGSHSPPPAADESGDASADSVHTNGVSGELKQTQIHNNHNDIT